MKYGKKTFASEAEKQAFVLTCENQFEAYMEAAARRVADDRSLRAVALCGPTCSGKTTIAAKLTEELEAQGRSAKIISIDDFFRDTGTNDDAVIQSEEKIDYDSIDAIHFDDLARCVNDVLEGRDTDIPIFDFSVRRRKGYQHFIHQPDDIVIFEGIQAIYPEVRALFPPGISHTLYVSVESDLAVGEAVFSRHEVRFLRRLVRDYLFRSASPEFTCFLWQSVRENEDKSILPYAHTADIRIDSLLAYEINLIKSYAAPLLDAVPAESVFYPAVQALREKFDGIEDISYHDVPRTSLYREFLGEKKGQ